MDGGSVLSFYSSERNLREPVKGRLQLSRNLRTVGELENFRTVGRVLKKNYSVLEGVGRRLERRS